MSYARFRVCGRFVIHQHRSSACRVPRSSPLPRVPHRANSPQSPVTTTPAAIVACGRTGSAFEQPSVGAPFFTVEVSFDGTFHLPAEWQLAAGSEHLLWQKEQLINLAVQWLPAEFNRVAWIDADLLFLNPDWAEETTQLLDHFPVVQLFENCHYANATGRIVSQHPSLLRKRREGLKVHGLPGGAWAARRDWLAEHSLYSRNIIGGGDVMFSDAPASENCTASSRKSVLRRSWSRTISGTGSPGGRVRRRSRRLYAGVIHCYHGTRERRRYVERAALLRQAQFDPATDLTVGSQGLLQWTGTKPELAAGVRAYFRGGREDE